MLEIIKVLTSSFANVFVEQEIVRAREVIWLSSMLFTF